MASRALQTTHHIMMVRPANFGFNTETAESNAFQTFDDSEDPEFIKEKAIVEFDTFVNDLRTRGIKVHVIEDTISPVKPDAVFPNNWITFHEDGSIVTYHMQAEVRRLERRDDIIYELSKDFELSKRFYMEQAERSDIFLEGTGSLILDRVYKIAYACLSPRTDNFLLNTFCENMGYQKAVFHAVDGDGKQIYHTNVMMALGEDFVVICMDSIPDSQEKEELLYMFEKTGKEVIPISLAQMNSFAGNMLQVRNETGETYLVMSEQAFNALRADQIETIRSFTQILHVPIYTIEKYGGGSARCMMAEIFLPEKEKLGQEEM